MEEILKEWDSASKKLPVKQLPVKNWGPVSSNDPPGETIVCADIFESPHVALCEDLIRQTEGLKSDFANVAPKIITSILEFEVPRKKKSRKNLKSQATAKLDPLLQCYLLALYLEKMRNSDTIFQEAYQPFIDIFHNLKILI